MKKTNLLPGPRQVQLVALAKEINAREEVISAARRRTREAAAAWLCEVVLQGQAFLKVKASLPHGMFVDWVRIHCPLVTHRTATSYMRVASNWGEIANADEATSLRAALLLCKDNEEEGAPKVMKHWPAYLEGLGRVAKFRTFITKHPLAGWPEEGLHKMREDLLPIVSTLWPDRFA